MSPRAFLVLLVATAVALLGAVGVVAVQPRLSATEIIDGDPMFNTLNQRIADLRTITVQAPSYEAAVENRDGKWVATDHGDYPTKDGVVADLVKNLTAMTKVEPKTDNPDWYQYIQVADPAANPTSTDGVRITASAANGDVLVDTIIGSPSSSISAAHGRGGTFIRNIGQAQSWLVEGTLVVPDTLADWFDPIVNIPGPNVASVAVLIGDKTVFEANKPDASTGLYKIVHLDESVGSSDMVANDTKIHNLTAGIVNVTIQDARSLDSITLGDSARTDRFTTTDGMQLDVTLVDADGDMWAIFKASAPDGSDAAKTAAKVNSVADGWAFKLGNVRIAGLTVKLSDLVQAPGGQPGADEGAGPPEGAGAPFMMPGGQAPLPPGFGQGGPGAPLPAPLIPRPNQ